MKHGGQWSCVQDAILNKIAGYRRVCHFERPWCDENKISCDHATTTKSRRSAAAIKGLSFTFRQSKKIYNSLSFLRASIFFCTENLFSFLGFFRHSFRPVCGIFRHLSVSFSIFWYLLVEFAMLYIEFEGEKPSCNCYVIVWHMSPVMHIMYDK